MYPDRDDQFQVEPECRLCGQFLGYGYGPSVEEAEFCVALNVKEHFKKFHPVLEVEDIQANVDWHIR